MNGRRQLGPITRPSELASWVMMGSAQKGKSALLVEGRGDLGPLLSFADGQTCRIITADGKDNILEAMNIIRKSKHSGAFAIVDADFDHLELAPALPDDVVRTDTHDMETMMLCTDAFEKVILRHGYWTPGQVEVDVDDLRRAAAELLSRLLNAGLRLGYLRWANHVHNLRIRFDDIDLAKVVDPSTLLVREDRLEEAALRASSASAGSWAEIRARADALGAKKHDHWQVCNGHDLTMLLALHLSRKTGVTITRKTLVADLALAYSVADFQKTAVFARIVAWQQKNSPRRILR